LRTRMHGCRRTRLAKIVAGWLTLLGVAGVVIAPFTSPALGKASHAGWPATEGRLKMHKSDRDGLIRGTHRSDELLGGHGNDVILGLGSGDVIWGDYKPCCQPTHQHDVLDGGAGRDFIYASHGYNRIGAGAGNDVIHAHFGRGTIDCGSGHDWVNVSHRSRHRYHIRHCERVG
jgi:Ca2+-binding RTX toxin-like protein